MQCWKRLTDGGYRYGYITAGSGRWVSMTLRKPKKQKGVPQQNKPVSAPSLVVHTSSDDDAEDGEQDDLRAQVSLISTMSFPTF